MIERIRSGKVLSSTDLWQLKIFNSIIKKRHFQEIISTDVNSLLLAPELLNSLLIRLKMKLDEKLKQHKDLLKKILSNGNFSVIETLDLKNVEEIMQILSYTDLPIHLLREFHQLNLLKFLFEYKKHRIHHQEIDFMSNLWKTLS